jgi:hypothetical protein
MLESVKATSTAAMTARESAKRRLIDDSSGKCRLNEENGRRNFSPWASASANALTSRKFLVLQRLVGAPGDMGRHESR